MMTMELKANPLRLLQRQQKKAASYLVAAAIA